MMNDAWLFGGLSEADVDAAINSGYHDVIGD